MCCMVQDCLVVCDRCMAVLTGSVWRTNPLKQQAGKVLSVLYNLRCASVYVDTVKAAQAQGRRNTLGGHIRDFAAICFPFLSCAAPSSGPCCAGSVACSIGVHSTVQRMCRQSGGHQLCRLWYDVM